MAVCKKGSLDQGAVAARHELVVFVDSDSFVDPFAIYNLVQPFQDENMGGVSGRTDVANTYTNVLTKMQAVRYYIAFRIMKAAEGYFDAVTCLSRPLSCYRKELVLQHKGLAESEISGPEGNLWRWPQSDQFYSART